MEYLVTDAKDIVEEIRGKRKRLQSDDREPFVCHGCSFQIESIVGNENDCAVVELPWNDGNAVSVNLSLDFAKLIKRMNDGDRNAVLDIFRSLKQLLQQLQSNLSEILLRNFVYHALAICTLRQVANSVLLVVGDLIERFFSNEQLVHFGCMDWKLIIHRVISIVKYRIQMKQNHVLFKQILKLASEPFPHALSEARWLDMGIMKVDPYDPTSLFPLLTRKANESKLPTFEESMLDITGGSTVYVPNLSTNGIDAVWFQKNIVHADDDIMKILLEQHSNAVEDITVSLNCDKVVSEDSEGHRLNLVLVKPESGLQGNGNENYSVGIQPDVEGARLVNADASKLTADRPIADFQLTQRIENLRRATGQFSGICEKPTVCSIEGTDFYMSHVPFASSLRKSVIDNLERVKCISSKFEDGRIICANLGHI